MGMLAAAVLAGLLFTSAGTRPVHGAAGLPALADPDQACVQCHGAIVASYRATPMAQGSGDARAGFIPGAYTQPASGVHYEMVQPQEAGALPQMRYSRAASDGQPPLAGAMELQYSLGSGHRGRTYLHQVQGLWYELPINWYSKRGAWDMTPGYEHTKSMPAAGLPVDPNCLHCHATSIAEPAPQAANRFHAAPFAQGGVGCAACHGDPAAHLASSGRVAMIDPAKLPTARRDSICLQCHLEGEAIAYLPGKSLATFKPGQDLAETAIYFVRASRAGGGGRATSQYEALLRSACRRATGDSLTCTTCHDPHASPASAEARVAWFRGRCLSCHTSPAMATHFPEQPDCASCHMPTRETTDVSHEQLTDHDIEVYGKRRTPPLPQRDVDADLLVAVGAATPGVREQGLAYAQLAIGGNAQAAPRAQRLLEQAEAAGANDPVLHARLGYLLQRSGDAKGARAEYVAALNGNVWEPSALVNLAVLDVAEGRADEGARLLDRLVTANPGQTAAGLDLALLECAAGATARAHALLDRLTLFDPDDPGLRRFRLTGDYAGQHCALPTEEAHGH